MHPTARSSIEITEIDLGFNSFYVTMIQCSLNYMQYKLDFTLHIDIYIYIYIEFKTNISYFLIIY